jgi:uncharacterized protein (TIGR02679 family)
MMHTADERLQRLLGGAELAVVRQRLRRRYERAERDATIESIRLDDLDAAALGALRQLSGQASRASRSITLDVADLDARLLRAGLADSLRDALERIDGPIAPLASQRRERQAQWDALWCSPAHMPKLRDWLATVTARTLVKRLGREPEHAANLLAAADAVLGRLPAHGITRSQLAAATLGNAHALDAGRPVAALVLAAWRHRENTIGSDDETGPGTGETATERPRATWARAGVLVSELARPALFLNLPFPPQHPAPAIAGEPGYLSLRQLLRREVAWPVADRSVFVCENPDILAIAADRLGADCAPLVCTDGMPAAAQRTLLDQLAAAGAQLRYHGDFDWGGLAIGNHVMRTWKAAPWRFGATDYASALAHAPARPRDLEADHAIDAIWDSALGPDLREHGLSIAEEAVAESLLGDLGDA